MSETWPIDKHVVIFAGSGAGTKMRIEASEKPFNPLAHKTPGTDENQVRYGWNYAQLLAKGMGSDASDTLVTVLSEKKRRDYAEYDATMTDLL